jgi:hypothetical protein
MKGTEKFWSTAVNAMPSLVAEQLRQTNLIREFWRGRIARLARPECIIVPPSNYKRRHAPQRPAPALSGCLKSHAKTPLWQVRR